MEEKTLRLEDVHLRIIDQRIGMGIGGLDTVIRLYHIPSGILIEVPRGSKNQYDDRKVAMEMLEYGLASGLWSTAPTERKSDE